LINANRKIEESSMNRWNRLCLTLSLLSLMTLMSTGCNLNTAPGGGNIAGVPIVRILSPQAGATYLEGVSVNIQAQISNAGADIDRVEIALDDGLIASISDPNPADQPAFATTYGWLATGVGDHRLAVIAFRADGSASEATFVPITVRAGDGSLPVPQTTPFVLPTITPGGNTGAFVTLQPVGQTASTTQPTVAAGAPRVVAPNAVNVRRGPSLNFAPPMGSLQQGATTEILALSTAGDWYKIRYGGIEGWVYSTVVTVQGDISRLPRESGPPIPTLAPQVATATPLTLLPVPTSTPSTGANLVAGIVVLDPAQPVCAQTFTVGFDVANLGTQPTSGGGAVALVDLYGGDGSLQGETLGGFDIIPAGQTIRINMQLTISTWYNETHRLRLTIDAGNQIPETTDSDNVQTVEYVLAKGNCS